jgi:MoaA/NifB/PqqE/SkfB family radical SAM enzyme
MLPSEINIPQLVKEYYKSICFMFVPNVCDAKCYFCYIRPHPSGKARFSDAYLKKIDRFIGLSKNIGFTEFRFTGGEPLLFDNFNEIVKLIASHEISYTLLSNGIRLHKHVSALLTHKPKKISISYHSIKSYEAIFGVKIDLPVLSGDIQLLLSEGIEVSITILFLPENIDEIEHIIAFWTDAGVRSFKFIYPDIQLDRSHYRHYIEKLQRLNIPQDVNIRISDFTNHHCMLKNRGFISLETSKFNLYSCCTTVSNEKPYSLKELNADRLENTIKQIYMDASDIKEFPCKSHLSFCPIGLKNLNACSSLSRLSQEPGPTVL